MIGEEVGDWPRASEPCCAARRAGMAGVAQEPPRVGKEGAEVRSIPA